LQIINDFLAPIEKEIAALGPDGKGLQDYINAVKAYAAALKSQSFGMVAPAGMIGQEAFFQFVSVQRGDADKMIESTRSMFASQEALMKAMGGAQAQMQVTTAVKENAKTIDGVTFHEMTTQFTLPQGGARNPQAMQAQQMRTWMYGPGGMKTYVGKLAPDKVIGASGVSDATIQQLIASAKAGQDTLSASPAAKPTADQLPRTRIAGIFVAIDQIALTVANYAKAFGMPINFQLPQNLPPLGAAFTVEGTAIRGDGYIPVKTIQSVIAAGMQTYMQMQGGQQPGAAPGL
jgi:hypothetical protein